MKMDLRIDRYDNAMNRFMYEVINGFISVEPLLGSIVRVPSAHLGPTRYLEGDQTLDQQMAGVHAKVFITDKTVQSTDFEEFNVFLFEMAKSFIKDLSSQLFKNLREVLEHAGNVSDAGGERFSFDMYLEMLEKIQIDFDERGEPIMPTMVVHPDLFKRLSTIRPTAVQEKRKQEIIDRKKTEFNAKKRTRRLS